MSIWEKVKPEIVRKIRAASTEEEALKIFNLGESLLHELRESFSSPERIKQLLKELKIDEELIKEILAPIPKIEHPDDILEGV